MEENPSSDINTLVSEILDSSEDQSIVVKEIGSERALELKKYLESKNVEFDHDENTKTMRIHIVVLVGSSPLLSVFSGLSALTRGLSLLRTERYPHGATAEPYAYLTSDNYDTKEKMMKEKKRAQKQETRFRKQRNKNMKRF